MPGKSAVLVADFAENFACSMANEVQSYHWDQAQVTLHPVMAHVNDGSLDQGPTHTEAIYTITDDPKHDAAAVNSFLNLAYDHLKEKYNITHVVLWPDCCAAQYRGKAGFADASFTKHDTDLTLTRHFYEPSHGKSEADGLAAVVKHAATLAVTRGQTKIRNAEEFYSFCTSNMANVGDGVFKSREEKYQFASRKFFLVEPSAIIRDRPDRVVQPVKGTMKVHSVKPTGVPYEVQRKGNKHVYIATITAIDGSDSVEVSYMREEVTSTTGTFTWPCKRDVSTLSTCYILRKLSKPSQEPGRKLRYRFCEKELQQCVTKSKKIPKSFQLSSWFLRWR